MGQQQLLLIVVGVIAVGIAITIGMSLFKAHAIESKRDHIINECISLATIAQQYCAKPSEIGGGGKKFTGWSVPSQFSHTANGSFAAEVYADSVIITGTGNEVVTGNDSIKVQMTVLQSDYRVKVIN